MPPRFVRIAPPKALLASEFVQRVNQDRQHSQRCAVLRIEHHDHRLVRVPVDVLWEERDELAGKPRGVLGRSAGKEHRGVGLWVSEKLCDLGVVTKADAQVQLGVRKSQMGHSGHPK